MVALCISLIFTSIQKNSSLIGSELDFKGKIFPESFPYFWREYYIKIHFGTSYAQLLLDKQRLSQLDIPSV